jgi:hypothetical protein
MDIVGMHDSRFHLIEASSSAVTEVLFLIVGERSGDEVVKHLKRASVACPALGQPQLGP